MLLSPQTAGLPLLFGTHFVQISPCLLTVLLLLSKKELQQFTGIQSAGPLELCRVQLKAGRTKMLCCVDSGDANDSAGLGWCSCRSFGACLRSCRKDRPAVCLLEHNPGDQPQQAALETGWARGFERHRGALWSKSADGTNSGSVHLLALAAPLLGGSRIHRDRGFPWLSVYLQRDLGVRQTCCHLTLLLDQA